MNLRNIPVDMVKIRQQLEKYFTMDELKTICFDSFIDFENISGETKEAKTRELVLYCQRHNKLPELLQACQERRPKIDWPDPTGINDNGDYRTINISIEEHIDDYRATFVRNDNIARGRIDISLVSLAGFFSNSQLAQLMNKYPDDEATLMAVAVLLAQPHKSDDDVYSAGMLVHLINSKYSRVRFRAARSITSRANVKNTAKDALQIMKEGVTARLKKERGSDRRLYPKGALSEAERALRTR